MRQGSADFVTSRSMAASFLGEKRCDLSAPLEWYARGHRNHEPRNVPRWRDREAAGRSTRGTSLGRYVDHAECNCKFRGHRIRSYKCLIILHCMSEGGLSGRRRSHPHSGGDEVESACAGSACETLSIKDSIVSRSISTLAKVALSRGVIAPCATARGPVDRNHNFSAAPTIADLLNSDSNDGFNLPERSKSCCRDS